MKKVLLAKHIVNISHLETILSYCYFLCDNGADVVLLISFNHEVWKKKILDADVISQYALPASMKVVVDDFAPYIHSGDLYLCNFGMIKLTNRMAAGRYDNFRGFVQFDEGSGSWQNPFILLGIGIREKRRMKQPYVRYTAVLLLSWGMNALWKPNVDRWTWMKNGEIHRNYVSYLQKVYAAKLQTRRIDTPNLSETWIVLTNGAVEAGYLSQKVYIAWLKTLIEIIQTETNYIVLKCHPAEEVAKYEPLLSECVSVWRETDTIESLLADEKYHTIKVLGEYSTSLVTLNILYGINTYCVKSLVKVKMSGDFKRLFDAHVKPLPDKNQNRDIA